MTFFDIQPDSRLIIPSEKGADAIEERKAKNEKYPARKQKYTTFENERHVLSYWDEHLVTATVLGKETYVASNGVQTDYPLLYDSVTVVWCNPEYFSEQFKEAVRCFILSANALGKLPGGVEYRGPKIETV